MPFTEHTGLDFTYYPEPPKPLDPAPSLGEAISSAALLENDVRAMWDLSTRPTYPPTEGYDLGARLKELNLWEDRNHFLGVQSDPELFDIAGRMEEEQKARENLERYGWAGTALAVGMGLASPTMLIPLTAGGRGGKAALEGLMYGLGAGAAQEIPLQLAQEERSLAESAFGVGAATIAGGVLGGLVGRMGRDEMDRIISAVEGDMAKQPGGGTIPGSGGSARAGQDPGALRDGVGIKTLARIGPVTRVLTKETQTEPRLLMSQLSDAGTEMSGNIRGIPTAAGGTVENRIPFWYGKYWKVTQELDDAYAELVTVAPGKFRELRAGIKGYTSGPLTRAEFRQQIARAMFSGDEAAEGVTPQATKVAAFIRKELWDPLYKRGVETGIFNGNETALGDPTHMLRVFKHEAILAREQKFVKLLAANMERQLVDDFKSAAERYADQTGKVEDYIADVQRPMDEVAALREEFAERLAALEDTRATTEIDVDGQAYTVEDFEDLIAVVRQQAKEAGKRGDIAAQKQLRQDARGMIEIGGETLDRIKKDRATIRRRLRNLNRSAVVLAEKQAKKLEAIERIEDQNVETLGRAIRKGQQIQKKMDRWSDEKLDQEISKLKDQFASIAERVDKGEERIANIIAGDQKQDVALIERIQAVGPEQRGAPELAMLDVQRAMGGGVLNMVVEHSGDVQHRISELRLDDGWLVQSFTEKVRRVHNVLTQGYGFEKELAENIVNNANNVGVTVQHYRANVDAALKKFAEEHAKLDAPTPLHEKIRAANVAIGEQRWADARKLYAELHELTDKPDVLIKQIRPQVEIGAEDRLLGLDDVLKQKEDRLTTLAIRLDDYESLDREGVRELINDTLDAALRKMNATMTRRAQRAAKLDAAAEKLDPKIVQEHIARKTAKLDERREALNEYFRVKRKGENVDVRLGEGSFRQAADEFATAAKDNILGTYLRLPTVDILQQERGGEIARTLNMSTTEKFDIDGEMLSLWDFLEQDVEHLTRAHLRTMAPDVELMEKMKQRGIKSFDWREWIRPIVDERDLRLAQVNGAVDKSGKPRSKEWIEKEQAKISADYAESMKDIEVVVSRLRHTWGLPKNPSGMVTRIARVLLNWNTLRFMGGVTIASIPDLSKPIFRYGITKAFRDGFAPLVSDLKRLDLTTKQLKLAGSALDPIMHTRAAAVFDVMDDLGRHSKFERGLEYATNRMGIVGLFDYWTSGMKQIYAGITIPDLTNSIRVMVEGGTKAEIDYATRMLARNSIDAQDAINIWEEITQGGGIKHNGHWFPDTEKWKSQEATQRFLQAVRREVDNGIVTPGVERPNWVNETIAGRLVSQFQSFAFSSTTKTVMAGLQQRDAAVMTGMLFSLAFGGLSYYIWAMAVGGQAKEEMLKGDLAKWSDEMISRSGLMGVGETGHRILERIPGVAPYVSFSGQRNTRRAGDDLTGAAFGPSFDTLEKVGAVIMGIDDPTQGTLKQGADLAPYQNLFYTRQLFDAIVEGTGEALDLPENRR